MILGGYQKLTLIDYPGKLAATVFTVGCSFRCPFCHNPELVDLKLVHEEKSEQEFFKFLKKRKGKLEGVCITGGEPTIQPDIVGFIRKIRKLGFVVKLDTNGTRPDVLKKILDAKSIDYVAMDIKHSQEKYPEAVGKSVDIARVRLSVNLLMKSGIDYEFRTTVVPGIHAESDFEDIVKWIRGAKSYYLQKYREIKILDQHLSKKTKGKSLNLEKIKEKYEKNFGKMEIRG